jgi:hypothetical protein
LVDGEEGEEINELDPEIHCFGETSSFPHLSQSAYEESLMENQLNELRKGDKASSSPNKYNLRPKKKFGTPDVLEKPTNLGCQI